MVRPSPLVTFSRSPLITGNFFFDFPLFMKRFFALVAGVFSLGIPTASLIAQSFPFELNAWENADFRNRVLGSYGVRSPIEPEALSRQEAQFFNEQIVPVVNSGNYSAAARSLEGYITPETNANFDFTLATIYLQQGQLPRAARAYEAAIRKHPDFLRAYKNLGIVYSQTGEHERAIEFLTKAIELGVSYAMEGGADGIAIPWPGGASFVDIQTMAAEVPLWVKPQSAAAHSPEIEEMLAAGATNLWLDEKIFALDNTAEAVQAFANRIHETVEV